MRTRRNPKEHRRLTTKIHAADLQFVEALFEMGGGYVLDFTNRTFSEFFHDEVGVDIECTALRRRWNEQSEAPALFPANVQTRTD